jgi:hypothetical protein
MQTSSTNFRYMRQLVDDYFDMLDAQGVDYLIHDQADQGHIFSSVKDSYMLEPEQMAEQLGYPSVEAYIADAHRDDLIVNEKSINMSVALEHQMGRFIFHYDGDDLTVYDVKDDQQIVFSLDFDQQSLAVLALGVCTTLEKYNKSYGGAQ